MALYRVPCFSNKWRGAPCLEVNAAQDNLLPEPIFQSYGQHEWQLHHDGRARQKCQVQHLAQQTSVHRGLSRGDVSAVLRMVHAGRTQGRVSTGSMDVNRRQNKHWQEHCQQPPCGNISTSFHFHGGKGTIMRVIMQIYLVNSQLFLIFVP